MILPCLACLALLTATAVPAVVIDVETCSSVEVSNVRLNVPKLSVFFGDSVATFSVPTEEADGYWDYEHVETSVLDDGVEFSAVELFSSDAGSITVDSYSYDSDDSAWRFVVENAELAPYNTADYFDLLIHADGTYWVFEFPNMATSSNVFELRETEVATDNLELGTTYYYNVPTLSPDGVSIVREIVEILVSGITQLGAGIGGGVNAFAQALAFDVSGEALSVFMVFVVVFAGLALSVGLTRLIFGWLQNLGGH